MSHGYITLISKLAVVNFPGIAIGLPLSSSGFFLVPATINGPLLKPRADPELIRIYLSAIWAYAW